MLSPFFDHLTPRVTPRTQLLTAGCFWAAVGAFLSLKGIYLSYDRPRIDLLFSLLGGLILGAIKSHMVFRKVALRISERILRKTQPTCLGGLFSPKNWGLILAMMLLGRGIGWLPILPEIKTVIYVTVGSGLFLSSRYLWQAWRKPLMLYDLRMK